MSIMNHDRESTRHFVFLNVMTSHCGETLTPEKVDQIVAELTTEANTGPCSWAFKP